MSKMIEFCHIVGYTKNTQTIMQNVNLGLKVCYSIKNLTAITLFEPPCMLRSKPLAPLGYFKLISMH